MTYKINRLILPVFIKSGCLLLLTLCSFLGVAHQGIKFIENKGQWEDHILFEADIPSGKLFISKSKITYLFYNSEQLSQAHHLPKIEKMDCHATEVLFLQANEDIEIISEESTNEYFNYFIGNDRSRWASGVKGYRRLIIKNIYHGIDLVMEGMDESIKYSFVLTSYGDPTAIKMQYNGFSKVFLRNNELHLNTTLNEMTEMMPEVFQVSERGKDMLDCRFVLRKNILSFDFPGGYDVKMPIVIDPLIIFASYSGSYADNFGYTATYDDSAYAYSGGTVFSLGYPTTLGAFQVTFGGGHASTVYGSGNRRDVGILKYSQDGKKLIYATYLGGNGNEDPHSLVVDRNFNLFVFGNTSSVNFPIGAHFYDSSQNGTFDIFVAKFSPDGKQLLASTYIGGSDEDGLNGYYLIPFVNDYNESELGFNYGDSYRGEINIDKLNRVHVATTTKSMDFPVTSGVFQSVYGGGNQDACVIRLSNNLDSLLKSSFVGGSQDDAGYGIAFHSNGGFYVCGGTRSSNLPVISGKYQTSFQGGVADGFIYYISENFSTLNSGTYFGTDKYDQVYFVQTDNNDHVYVTGQTMSDYFPIKNVKYSNPKGKMFITKLNSGLDSMIYSTVFGSGRLYPDLSPSAFMVDYCERIYFSGWGGESNANMSRNFGSATTNLPLTPDAFQKTTDGSDFYVAVFSKDIQGLLFATYYGGDLSSDHVDGGTSRFDKKGVIYQSVCASCLGYNDFPTYPADVHSTTNNSSNCNNALFKIELYIPDLLARFNVDTIFCKADSTHIRNLSQGAETYIWDFGVNSTLTDTSTAFEPRYPYPDTGIYLIRLIASNINSCDQHDTAYQYILVYNQAESDFTWKANYCVNHIGFTGTSRYAQTYYWDFGDTCSKNNNSNSKTTEHIYTDTGRYTVTLIVDSGTVCENITVKEVYIPYVPEAGFNFTLDTCDGMVLLNNISGNSKKYLWYYGDNDSSSTDSIKHLHFYKTADSFVITLIAEPYEVCADTAYKQVNIITPKAEILADIDTCLWRVTFINPSTYSKNTSLWTFGDGNDTSSVDTIYEYQYANFGQYTVMLVANAGTLCVDTVYQNLELPELPNASFSFQRTDCEPDVLFKNNSQLAVKSLWDFGNGSYSQAMDSVIVKYSNPGDYRLSLMVYSAENCMDSIIDTVKIDHLALADFQISWDTCTNKINILNNSSKNGKYMWDFGDGKPVYETVLTFSHYFDTLGMHHDTSFMIHVRLIVEDPPCYDTLTKQIQVHIPPPIDFYAGIDSCLPIASFKSLSKGARNFFWDFGDGDTSQTENTVHEYADAGSYSVKFYINLNDICTDSVERTILLNKYIPEKIEIPNIFTPNNDLKNDLFTLRNLNFECDTYELIIFNRWGQELFRSNTDIYWDGKVNGKLVSEGTYYYVFKSNYFNTAGTITVIY